MKKIDLIVIHCSATREGRHFTAADIDRMHKQRGFRMIGYHYVVQLKGLIEGGRPLDNDEYIERDEIGAHAAGFNSHSIGICYIGGLDANGKGKDTRTNEQKFSLAQLVATITLMYPDAKIVGHRDLSPDLDGDGKISKWEWMKECPCFDVEQWLNDIGL